MIALLFAVLTGILILGREEFTEILAFVLAKFRR
jgi:hypothetical protein